MALSVVGFRRRPVASPRRWRRSLGRWAVAVARSRSSTARPQWASRPPPRPRVGARARACTWATCRGRPRGRLGLGLGLGLTLTLTLTLTSWQELKDHFRNAGEVSHADVMMEHDGRSKGCGIVSFASARDAANAINTLNQSELGRALGLGLGLG